MAKLENLVNRLELNPQSKVNTSWPETITETEAQSLTVWDGSISKAMHLPSGSHSS